MLVGRKLGKASCLHDVLYGLGSFIVPASNRESRARRIPLDIKVLDPAKVDFAEGSWDDRNSEARSHHREDVRDLRHFLVELGAEARPAACREYRIMHGRVEACTFPVGTRAAQELEDASTSSATELAPSKAPSASDRSRPPRRASGLPDQNERKSRARPLLVRRDFR